MKMKLSFRWYGESDPVSLQYISQIPGMRSIVSAVFAQRLNAKKRMKLKNVFIINNGANETYGAIRLMRLMSLIGLMSRDS